nr:prolyl oligopeptidase family serine peptidase [Cupriavidus sp. UYPR2.512]
MVDLTDPDWPVRTLVDTFDDAWLLAGNIGTKLFLSTQNGAGRGKFVTVDLADPEPVFTELIPERDDAVLRVGALVGGRLVVIIVIIVINMVDAKAGVKRYKLDGTPDGVVELSGIGSTSPFVGRPGDDEAFFVFTSHEAPTSIYRYDVAANTSTVWAAPKVPVDLDRIVVEQRFYSPRDGTQVPIFIVRRVDVTGPSPTMLTGYGGFSIPTVPLYSPAAMAWVEQGGVYAVANIRGGGEYGKAWHDAGRLRNKQNTFDDFSAAGEFLKVKGSRRRRGWSSMANPTVAS